MNPVSRIASLFVLLALVVSACSASGDDDADRVSTVVAKANARATQIKGSSAMRTATRAALATRTATGGSDSECETIYPPPGYDFDPFNTCDLEREDPQIEEPDYCEIHDCDEEPDHCEIYDCAAEARDREETDAGEAEVALELTAEAEVVYVDEPAPAEDGSGSDFFNCDSAYPDFCIPPPDLVGDLECEEVDGAYFTVYFPDPHGFDGDYDGLGCEWP